MEYEFLNNCKKLKSFLQIPSGAYRNALHKYSNFVQSQGYYLFQYDEWAAGNNGNGCIKVRYFIIKMKDYDY